LIAANLGAGKEKNKGEKESESGIPQGFFAV